jgi:hypothetical protein
VQGISATVLGLGATDEIDLTATTVDLNGTLNVSGIATFQAAPVFPDGSLALADLDIDGGTEIGAAIVDADLFIVDDGAGGTNRKCLASRLKTYAGATNTPAMYAILSGDQTLSNDTATVCALATEVLDSDGTFNNSTYRWTPAVAGYYMLVGQVYIPGCDDGERIYCSFFINNSESNHNSIKHGMTVWAGATNQAQHQQTTAIVYLDGDDYVDFRAAQSSGDDQDTFATWTYMAGYRITGV